MVALSDYEKLRSVSKARERRVKEELKKLFPSFQEDIERLRIRHHIELLPLADDKNPHRAKDLVAMYRIARQSNAGDIPNMLADTERYIARYLGKGQFFGERTYGTRYFPDSWEEGLGIRSTDVHEFAHYITFAQLRKAFGRRALLQSVVPLPVHEAIAFAFQAEYERMRGAPRVRDPAKIAYVYGFKGRDRALFSRLYYEMREEIQRNGLDAAAKRIPDIVQKYINLSRKQFKQR